MNELSEHAMCDHHSEARDSRYRARLLPLVPRLIGQWQFLENVPLKSLETNSQSSGGFLVVDAAPDQFASLA
jgi:hypothetical protein